MVKAISKKSKGGDGCPTSEDASSLGRGKHHHSGMDGMVTTPDAQSGSKVAMGSSMNTYRQYIRGEVVQSRILMPHSGTHGQLEVGVECHQETEGLLGGRADLRGPVYVESMSKEGSRKKEDKWLLKPKNSWSCGDSRTHVGAWGIFDGHGGRQVATYASHALIKYVAEYCGSPCEVETGSPQEDEVSDGDSYDSYISPRVLGGGEHGDEGEIEDVLKEESCMEEWGVQYELMKRLPWAVQKAFLKCDEMACKQFAHGGTTATMAFVCGWQLLVANVGDSCAYFDTGSEVLAVSGNHRLEDNAEEVKRIEESGGEVEPSSIDGKPAGPIRVWPGGLAMSRTIGDADAGDLCAARADVAQMTIPKDGGRLFIASDGLWDAVHYKTAAHHTRDMTASEASHKLLSMAIKKDHLKDDVTIIVVDFMPSEECRIPPGLHLHRPAAGKKGKGKSASIEKLAYVWHPLDGAKTTKWIEEELQRRVQTLRDVRIQEEEEKYLMERRMEIEEEQKKKNVAEEKQGSSSSLLDELVGLTLSPEDFGRDDDEWKTVKPTSPTDSKQKTKKKKQKKKQVAGSGMKQSMAPPPPPTAPPAGVGLHKNENEPATKKKAVFFKRNKKNTRREDGTRTEQHQKSDTVSKVQNNPQDTAAGGAAPQKKTVKRHYYYKKKNNSNKNVKDHSGNKSAN